MAKLTSQQRAELEAEREFLVRSLDDLDAERVEGAIDDATYETLHSDYTARTAAVLRSLASGATAKESAPRPPPVPPGRRWLIVGAIVVFGGTAAFALAKSSGTRAQGGLPSGGVTVPTAAPNTYQGHLDAALRFRSEGIVDQAVQEYLAAAKLRPKLPDPLVDIADMFLARIAGGLSTDQRLITQAGQLVDQALKIDPKYPPAYIDRALVARAQGKPVSQSVADFRRYLQLDPNGAQAGMARTLIQQLTAPSTSTTTPTSTRTTTSITP